MQLALEHARLSPDQVDYFNAHAIPPIIATICETRAIKQVFGDTAYKVHQLHQIDDRHLLGGAAGRDGRCALAIARWSNSADDQSGKSGEECDLDYTPNVAREKKVRVALNNSFALAVTTRHWSPPHLRNSKRAATWLPHFD